jgi:T-complex protein 1 subunit delta
MISWTRLATGFGAKSLPVSDAFLSFIFKVVVSDYAAMDRVLREERAYILNIVKQIKKAGCNVLLIQKSILRDALSDLAIHFFDKMKIMVVKDIEREDVEFICKTLNCRPIASLDHFTAENLVSVETVEEVNMN